MSSIAGMLRRLDPSASPTGGPGAVPDSWSSNWALPLVGVRDTLVRLIASGHDLALE